MADPTASAASKNPQTSPAGIPWYPPAIAAAYVLNVWTEAGVSILAVTRSLLIAIAVMAVLTAGLALVTRRRHVAGVLALLVFGIGISRGPQSIGLLAILVVAASAAIVLWGRVRRTPLSWASATKALNTFGLILLLVVASGAVMRGTLWAIPTDLRQGAPALEADGGTGAGEADAPDVVILILDGYPRSDWLDRLYGGDNSDFLAALAERGFDVAEESTSNYMFTQLTLSSMLQMTPVPDIAELEPAIAGSADAQTRLRAVVNDNPVFDAFRSHGYRIVTSSPGYEGVALRQSDVYLDAGALNDFEYHLFRSTILQGVMNAAAPYFFADQQRHRVLSGFDHYREVTTTEDQPSLAIIHVPVPHLPVVIGADGGRADLPPSGDIFGRDTQDLPTPEAYRDQLAYLNRTVLEMVDGALATERTRPEPILIVMSDHGAGKRPEVFEGDGGPQYYANLFAARIPGADGVFPENATPINLFPTLIARLFGDEVPTWPNEPYPWVPVP